MELRRPLQEQRRDLVHGIGEPGTPGGVVAAPPERRVQFEDRFGKDLQLPQLSYGPGDRL
ncbi:hypothetical protein ABZ916_08855 [Streptomyces sp. NPDC046853]|uniref:hypothetical protein n=1 Tax=Streptomyces sp. NPDC046853 TaxID=3154920 RepID=UPI003408C119